MNMCFCANKVLLIKYPYFQNFTLEYLDMVEEMLHLLKRCHWHSPIILILEMFLKTTSKSVNSSFGETKISQEHLIGQVIYKVRSRSDPPSHIPQILYLLDIIDVGKIIHIF